MRTGMTVAAVAVAAALILAGCGGSPPADANRPATAPAETPATSPTPATAPADTPATSPKEKPTMAPIDLTHADTGNTAGVPAGRLVRIRLEGNPTTGYSWFLAGIDGESVEAEGEVTYAARPHEPGRVGVGGTFELLVKAVRPGRSTVRMEYKRPWEADRPAEETFAVTLEVK